MNGTSKIVTALMCSVALLNSASSQAGTLNGHSAALPGWTGTVAFDNGDLEGNLDYAVFTAADFNANFSGLGYTPGDAIVYTYQLENGNNATTDSISAQIVGILNSANTIGTFDIGDVDASSANFVGLNAEWQFNPEIPAGQTSWGLAFSSPSEPMEGVALTIDGGSSVLELGVPTPAPEPSSLLLLVVGGMLASWCGRRSR